ncbi:MAG TPA: glycosyltransferase, partial [Micrococcaceae bacterium]
MAAVAAQTRPADAVLAADAGSADDSLALLERALGRGKVISHAARGGFGAAVKAAVDQLAPPAGLATTDQEWLWLLHDDAAPAPDALA